MATQDYFAHSSAIIDQGAQIGKGTQIWHFSHLMGSCKVGAGCKLGQNVYIDANVTIGNGVKIQNNVSVFNGVIVEDDVFLGPSMVFTNVINPRIFIERKNMFRKTLVRKGATIGANATIICGVEIGAYAMIGAGAVVTKNVPAYALMKGNPARQAGWISEAGHTLKFDENNMATCPEMGVSYSLIENILSKMI
jgi:UDP-2-acetamido-3-amino-2,3-dideoxy-glucuronate N-acetyltransferase